jgi:hypothetical protein
MKSSREFKTGRQRHRYLVPAASSRSLRSGRRTALVNCELWCVAVAPETGIITKYYRRHMSPVTNTNPPSLYVIPLLGRDILLTFSDFYFVCKQQGAQW